jgi:hypothetical protein
MYSGYMSSAPPVSASWMISVLPTLTFSSMR